MHSIDCVVRYEGCSTAGFIRSTLSEALSPSEFEIYLDAHLVMALESRIQSMGRDMADRVMVVDGLQKQNMDTAPES